MHKQIVTWLHEWKKTVIILLLSLSYFYSSAQDHTIKSVTQLVKTEQQSFRKYLDTTSIDTNIVNRLRRFVNVETDSIQKSISSNRKISNEEKIRGIRSLVFIMKGMREKLDLQKPETYDIPGSLDSYKAFLHSMLHKTGYENVLEPLGAQRSQMLANAFWQCGECDMLDEIVVYKRLASAPDYILPNLEKNQDFHFRDSLILLAVKHDPLIVANYLRRNKTGIADVVRQSENKYVRQVVQLSENKNAEDLLPFTQQLAEGTISPEEIIKERSDVKRYFQLLINTLNAKLAKQQPDGFENTLMSAIKQKALYFFNRSINEQHDDPDNVRFASLNGLRAQDLYYLIVSSDEDLYTSSYLGLYKRMMAQLGDKKADSLFTTVSNNQFQRFISLAANYNVLEDFLQHMDEAKAKELLHLFIGGIENDTQNGLEKAMNVADLFTVLSSSPVSVWINDELKTNYSKTKAAQQYFGARLYDILLQVYDLVKQNDPAHKLWDALGNHEELKHDALKNEKGEINELVLFYGDKDGIASYNSFMNLFKDKSQWEVTKNEQWVTIRSLKNQGMNIYANLPLSNEEKKDLLAQDALSAYLKQQSIEPSVLIHRGHSYHLEHTFKQLQPSMKLVVLGSCGGYNNNLSIANFSPEAQIIVSKKVGSKFINDPMIDIINKDLLAKKDLKWKQIWSDIAGRLKNNPFALNMFNEYLPPAKNVNLFVLKLFNHTETGKSVAIK